MATLPVSEWQRLSAAHRQRVSRWTAPARRRRDSGIPHPVEDFLFTYYPFSFGKLETWYPPFGTSLEVSDTMEPQFKRAPYRRQGERIFADPSMLTPKAQARLVWIRELLNQTRGRTANFSCHGMHEWAMVYRGHEIRHEASTPLRLSQSEIDSVVESRPIACSHFDAFRFFNPETQKFNSLQPSLDGRSTLEQPGCIHANMDLYKWASKAMPWIGSDLQIECFELAIRLRGLDMRASPYDLTKYGLTPVAIETPAGRREYEVLQRQLSAEAHPLRARLIARLDLILSSLLPTPGSCHEAAGGLRPQT